jgi:hypothetical protein
VDQLAGINTVFGSDKVTEHGILSSIQRPAAGRPSIPLLSMVLRSSRKVEVQPELCIIVEPDRFCCIWIFVMLRAGELEWIGCIPRLLCGM